MLRRAYILCCQQALRQPPLSSQSLAGQTRARAAQLHQDVRTTMTSQGMLSIYKACLVNVTQLLQERGTYPHVVYMQPRSQVIISLILSSLHHCQSAGTVTVANCSVPPLCRSVRFLELSLACRMYTFLFHNRSVGTQPFISIISRVQCMQMSHVYIRYTCSADVSSITFH